MCGKRWCARARCRRLGGRVCKCCYAARRECGESAGLRVCVMKAELAPCSERETEQGGEELGAAAPASSHGVVLSVWGAAGEGAPRRSRVWLHLPRVRGVCTAVVVAVGVSPATQGWVALGPLFFTTE